MLQFLGMLWYILLIVPALFWFLIVKKFNMTEKAKFPAIVYSIFYLIPFVHFFIAWSFVKDVAEKQDGFPIVKTYLVNLALPYVFLTIGLQLFVIIGAIFDMIGIPFALKAFAFLATVTPYLSFIWFAWGFWSLQKSIVGGTSAKEQAPVHS